MAYPFTIFAGLLLSLLANAQTFGDFITILEFAPSGRANFYYAAKENTAGLIRDGHIYFKNKSDHEIYLRRTADIRSDLRDNDLDLKKWDKFQHYVSPENDLVEVVNSTDGSLSKVYELARNMPHCNTEDGYVFSNNEVLETYRNRKKELKAITNLKKAKELFVLLKQQKQIPFGQIADGCFNRDYEMARVLALNGTESRKVTLYGSLAVKSEEKQSANWWRHVAPVILVQVSEGEFIDMVLDPSIMTGPATIPEWINSMTHEDCKLTTDNSTKLCSYQIESRSQDLWNAGYARENRHQLEFYSKLLMQP